MKYNNLDETFKDVTFTHYVAHNIAYVSPFEKHYYCVIPTGDISSIEVSVLSDDWLVMGVTDLPKSAEISTGDKLKVNPINQNNKQSARTSMYKNTKLNTSIKDKFFIDQVYINVYQKNKILLGLKRIQRYYIEVKNTRDASVYYNININFADGSSIHQENACDMRPASESI